MGARRRPGQQQIWLEAAAGALLVIAVMDVLPDAWSQARAAGIWPWAVPVAAAGAFWLTGLAARLGCTCGRDTRQVGGAGAAALAAHRYLEDPAMVLTGSATVVTALAMHALGEGLAVGALLSARPRRVAAAWLAAMRASPLTRALVTGACPVPAAARPMLLALAGSVLAQAARMSLRAAGHDRSGRFLVSGPAAATTVAAAITMLAVHAAG